MHYSNTQTIEKSWRQVAAWNLPMPSGYLRYHEV